MILSSANILEILQGSAVIRMAASEIRIVDKKPIASGREGFYVYIEKYPTLEEFEATWRVWIESDGSEPDDLLLAEMRRLLPNFEFKLGLIIEATVRDFKSDNTEARPKPSEAPVVMPPTGWIDGIEKRFEELVEDIQDRMLLVGSGRPGKDGARGPEGRPGAPGRDGRDGKDLVATSAMLGDLIDVKIEDRLPLKKGQVLTYNGSDWENLHIPQLQALVSGGGEDTTVVTGGQGSQISWIYHEETGEPHARKFHTHGETDATLVTELHVSKTNAANNDVELLLDAILPITNQIYISDNDDPSQAHLYDLTSYTETTDGFNLVISHVETPGPEPSFIANDQYDFLFLTGASSGGATSIDELTDVDTSTTTPFVGQTLVWDGTNWVPGDSSEGIGEAPIDGNFYVRSNGQWINLIEAINFINLLTDGGNFTLGEADTVDRYIYDGGDFINNTSDTGEQVPPAEGYEGLDGGDFS
jgi:hypothetical protein